MQTDHAAVTLRVVHQGGAGSCRRQSDAPLSRIRREPNQLLRNAESIDWEHIEGRSGVARGETLLRMAGSARQPRRTAASSVWSRSLSASTTSSCSRSRHPALRPHPTTRTSLTKQGRRTAGTAPVVQLGNTGFRGGVIRFGAGSPRTKPSQHRMRSSLRNQPNGFG